MLILPVPRRSPRFWEDDLRDYIEEFNKTHTTKINANIIAHNYMLAQQTHLARKPARRRRQPIQVVPVPIQALPAAPQPVLLAPQQVPLALQQPPQPIEVLPVLPRVDDENDAGAFDDEAIGQLVGQEDGELQGDDDDHSMDVKDSNEPGSGEDNTNVVHLAETSSSASHDISIDDESNIASSEVDEPRSRIFQDKTLDGTLVNSVSEGHHAVVGEKIAHQGISQLLLSSSIVGKAVGPTLDEQSVAQDDLPLQLLDLSSPDKSVDAELFEVDTSGSVQSAMDASEVEEALCAGLLVDDAVEGDVPDQDHFDMPTEPSTNGEMVEDDQPVVVATASAEMTPGPVVHHQPDVDDVTYLHDVLEEYEPASVAPSPVAEAISKGSAQAEPVVDQSAAMEGQELGQESDEDVEIARGVINGKTKVLTVDHIERFVERVHGDFQQEDLVSLRAQCHKVQIQAEPREQHWVFVSLLAPIVLSDITVTVRSTPRLTVTDMLVLFAIFDPVIDFKAYCYEQVVRLSPRAEEVRMEINDTSLGANHTHSNLLEGGWELFGHHGLRNPELHSVEQPSRRLAHARRLVQAMHTPTCVATEPAQLKMAGVSADGQTVQVQAPAMVDREKRKHRLEHDDSQPAKKARTMHVPDTPDIVEGCIAPNVVPNPSVSAVNSQSSGSISCDAGPCRIACVADDQLVKEARNALSDVLKRWNGRSGQDGRQTDTAELKSCILALTAVKDLNMPNIAKDSVSSATLIRSFLDKVERASKLSPEETKDGGKRTLEEVKRRATSLWHVHKSGNSQGQH